MEMGPVQSYSSVEFTYPSHAVADHDYTAISRQGSTYATINDLHIDTRNNARVSVKSGEYNKSNFKYNDVTLDPNYSRLKVQDPYSHLEETSDQKDVTSVDYSHRITTATESDYNRTTDKPEVCPPTDYSHIRRKDGQKSVSDKPERDYEDHAKSANGKTLDIPNSTANVREDLEANECLALEKIVPADNKVAADSLEVKKENHKQVPAPTLQLPRKLSSSSDSSDLDGSDEYPEPTPASSSEMKILDNDNSKIANDGYETVISKSAGNDAEKTGSKAMNDGYETALPVANGENDSDNTKVHFRTTIDVYGTDDGGDINGTL